MTAKINEFAMSKQGRAFVQLLVVNGVDREDIAAKMMKLRSMRVGGRPFSGWTVSSPPPTSPLMIASHLLELLDIESLERRWPRLRQVLAWAHSAGLTLPQALAQLLTRRRQEETILIGLLGELASSHQRAILEAGFIRAPSTIRTYAYRLRKLLELLSEHPADEAPDQPNNFRE